MTGDDRPAVPEDVEYRADEQGRTWVRRIRPAVGYWYQVVAPPAQD